MEAIYATPFRIVQMLMNGTLDGMANARGSILRKDHQAHIIEINRIISVIDALRGALDFENGGKIAKNLDMLYDSMTHHLYIADIEQDVAPIDEMVSLLNKYEGIVQQIVELNNHTMSNLGRLRTLRALANCL
ncbi:MAG: flagellar export chaperone FliS [Candidatus Thiodiazotropha sp.]